MLLLHVRFAWGRQVARLLAGAQEGGAVLALGRGVNVERAASHALEARLRLLLLGAGLADLLEAGPRGQSAQLLHGTVVGGVRVEHELGVGLLLVLLLLLHGGHQEGLVVLLEGRGCGSGGGRRGRLTGAGRGRARARSSGEHALRGGRGRARLLRLRGGGGGGREQRRVVLLLVLGQGGGGGQIHLEQRLGRLVLRLARQRHLGERGRRNGRQTGGWGRGLLPLGLGRRAEGRGAR